MKKILLMVLSSPLFTLPGHAQISTGFYTGISGSYIHTHAKQDTSKRVAHVTTLSFKKSPNNNLGGLGAYVGYGLLADCFYYAGEFGYELEPKRFHFHKTIQGTNSFESTFKRRHNFIGALRLGFLFNQSTMGYLSVAANYGKYHHVTSFKDKAGIQPSMHLSYFKWHFSFVPGLGVEKAFTKNIIGRIQWTYDFGCKFRAHKTDTLGQTYRSRLKTIHTQKLTFGIAYKF